MSETEIEVHFGESREAMAERFVSAWHRAEAGAAMAERHLSFDSFATMTRVLTPRRIDLLRALRHQTVASVAALSRVVRRDYRRVHADVDALTAAGLIERDAGRYQLRAPYDVIRTEIVL